MSAEKTMNTHAKSKYPKYVVADPAKKGVLAIIFATNDKDEMNKWLKDNSTDPVPFKPNDEDDLDG